MPRHESVSHTAESLISHELKRLGIMNRFHAFEELCLAFANMRLGGHFVPATGPVAAGGDQGRDFESYVSWERTAEGLVLRGRAVGVCTTQEKSLVGKIRSDVEKVMAGNQVEVVYAFLTADLAVARVHELQAEVREKYGDVELEVFDGNRLAHALAGRDLVEVAFRLLGLDPRLLPELASASGAKDPQPVFTRVLADGFTGREWLVARIEEFIATRTSGFVWIEAEAGMGKTTLAAHLVREKKWLSHFAHYTRGEVSAIALGNLASQFAMVHRLPQPVGAVTPEDFETLLTEAAGLSDRPIVLVVDGADEAEKVEGLLPWGLPRLLPEGVFVVGTYRTGRPPGHVDAPSTVLRIDADDPRNRDDLAAHLDRMVEQDDLAAKLAEVGISSTDFTRALAERCGGVWVYLHYVLAEIRHGQRGADDLRTLPADLGSYYATHLERWTEPGLRTFLTTLAVAGEPVHVSTAATLAGVAETSARRWCDDTLRPFLAASTELPRKFAILHASLREFLTGTFAPDAGDTARSWSETLAEEAKAAHRRIADHYAAMFDLLVADPSAANVDDGYALRHLAFHFREADRFPRLHRLLSLTRRTGSGQTENVWLKAQVNDPTEFLRDVHIAAKAAPTAALELRYRLIAAAVDINGYSFPGELLAALLERGIWPLERVIANARRAPLTFGALAPLLPQERMSDALDAVLSWDADWVTAEVLKALVPYLSDDLVGRALAHALQMRKADHRLAVELALLPRLSLSQQLELRKTLIIDIVHNCDRPGHRERMRHLARHVHEDLIDPTGIFVTKVPDLDEWTRFEILVALSSRLPVRLNHVLKDALEITETFDEVERLCAGVVLGFGAVDEAFDAVMASPRETDRSNGLARLAPHLTPSMAVRAVDTAIKFTDQFDRVGAISALVGQVSPAVRIRAYFSMIEALAQDMYLEEELEGLLAHLPPRPVELLLGLIERAHRMWHRTAGEQIIRAVVAKASPDIKDAVLDRALSLIRATSKGRARALAFLIKPAPAERRPELIEEALAASLSSEYDLPSITSTERALAHHTNAKVQALPKETTTQNGGPNGPAQDVERILRLVSEGDVGPLIRHASKLRDPEHAAQLASSVPHLYDRGLALAVLARHLSGEPRTRYTDLALDAADQCLSTPRHIVLATLAKVLLPEQVTRVVSTRADPGTPSDVALTLNRLVDHPAFPLTMDQVLDEIISIENSVERAQALVDLTEHLGGATFDRALHHARRFDDATLKALVLLALAHASGRSDLTAEGLRAVAAHRPVGYYTSSRDIPRLYDRAIISFAECGVARPYGDRDPGEELLVSVGAIRTPEADAALIDVLRRETHMHSLLSSLESAAPFLPRIIGADGMDELVRTLQDIQLWLL
ncbi:hypothetical protein ADK67_32895 [Saccharothrix sp. NRRL B-16348]|uniref:hypothetical protein n=1 Tax=Saccharothrix sp. NRRL B-16348 TaxID=1415542 RepID=UPI0006AED5F4|nr:hypothetical protein [Saccharothrix sp. NRRL B-16348]KOX19729.1 hypothetical protein ADK67_32895 [Saccharothrix sp. NRRL B-16348]